MFEHFHRLTWWQRYRLSIPPSFNVAIKFRYSYIRRCFIGGAFPFQVGSFLHCTAQECSQSLWQASIALCSKCRVVSLKRSGFLVLCVSQTVVAKDYFLSKGDSGLIGLEEAVVFHLLAHCAAYDVVYELGHLASFMRSEWALISYHGYFGCK